MVEQIDARKEDLVLKLDQRKRENDVAKIIENPKFNNLKDLANRLRAGETITEENNEQKFFDSINIFLSSLYEYFKDEGHQEVLPVDKLIDILIATIGDKNVINALIKEIAKFLQLEKVVNKNKINDQILIAFKGSSGDDRHKYSNAIEAKVIRNKSKSKVLEKLTLEERSDAKKEAELNQFQDQIFLSKVIQYFTGKGFNSVEEVIKELGVMAKDKLANQGDKEKKELQLKLLKSLSDNQTSLSKKSVIDLLNALKKEINPQDRLVKSIDKLNSFIQNN